MGSGSALAPTCYQPSAPSGYKSSAPNSSAKGLLNPFKGKGGVYRLRDELESEADVVIQEGRDFEQRYNGTPLIRHVGLCLRAHNIKQHRVPFIRWRDRFAAKMGMSLWEAAMCRQDLTPAMREELYEIEVQRILHNARAGVINSELRRLRSVIPNLERAEAALERRV